MSQPGNRDNQFLTAKPFVKSPSYTPKETPKRENFVSSGCAMAARGGHIRNGSSDGPAPEQGQPWPATDSVPSFSGLWRFLAGSNKSLHTVVAISCDRGPGHRAAMRTDTPSVITSTVMMPVFLGALAARQYRSPWVLYAAALLFFFPSLTEECMHRSSPDRPAPWPTEYRKR